MSATTQPKDFSDIYTAILNAVRGDTGNAATVSQAKRYANTALIDMHIGNGERFRWANRQATLRTQAPYSTGTVSITQGSSTLTGSGTAWNTNNAYSVKNVRAGGKLNLGGDVVYEVSSVSSDTSLTLTTPYIGSDLSGGTYSYFEDEYALATDFLRPVDWRHFTTNAEIGLIGRTEFRRQFPRNNTPGTPRVAMLTDVAMSGSTARQQRVTFYQPPNSTLLLPYSYVTAYLAVSSAGAAQLEMSADTDEPIVPVQFRHLLPLLALAHWYRDKRDDTRSAEAQAQADRLLSAIVSDNEIGAPRPRLQPRIGPYVSRARRPWRGGGGGRHSLGTRFDEMR